MKKLITILTALALVTGLASSFVIANERRESGRCDNIDNDEDTFTDEHYVRLGKGQPCDPDGPGVLGNVGRKVCDTRPLPGKGRTAGNLWCVFDADLGDEEVCDSADNDADGTTDESCITCGPELCNGIDDDKDGVTDNGFDLGAACTNGYGTCVAAGVKVCSTDTTGESCNAVPGTPGAETCVGTDDDCDGLVDCSDCDCSEGCTAEDRPAEDPFDGVDNDCDGETDEGP